MNFICGNFNIRKIDVIVYTVLEFEFWSNPREFIACGMGLGEPLLFFPFRDI